LTNMPAALGLSQFKRIDQFIRKRKKLALEYDKIFKESDQVRIDFENKNSSIFYRYPILIKNRNFIKIQLQKRKIFQFSFQLMIE
ncbi:MAG: DegT/DnrJ/EryC1/StrS family aminotransferase, partial [Nitrososphaeraceae archaeon]